jgi:hypothetical protein
MTPDPVRPGRMLPRHVAALVVLVFLVMTAPAVDPAA